MRERLQKIIAGAGITSRRKAEELIRCQRVTVNGKFVTQLGVKADPGVDHIKVDGKMILPQPKEYFAFHKPKAVLSAASDSRGRAVAVDYIRSKSRLYPAGRLDFNSEGLLILTNDGEMARRIMKAGDLEKVYRVKVQGNPSREGLDQLVKGIKEGGELLKACRVRRLKSGNNCWLEVVLKQGRNRQVRRMFEQLGHSVMRLRRISVGPVKLGDLRAGDYRKLTSGEVSRLHREARRGPGRAKER